MPEATMTPTTTGTMREDQRVAHETPHEAKKAGRWMIGAAAIAGVAAVIALIAVYFA